jgi:hypothetical protein
VKLTGRADEDPDFVRLNPLLDPSGDSRATSFRLLFQVIEGLDRRAGPLNTDTVPRRSSALPSTSAKAGGKSRSA